MRSFSNYSLCRCDGHVAVMEEGLSDRCHAGFIAKLPAESSGYCCELRHCVPDVCLPIPYTSVAAIAY